MILPIKCESALIIWWSIKKATPEKHQKFIQSLDENVRYGFNVTCTMHIEVDGWDIQKFKIKPYPR